MAGYTFKWESTVKLNNYKGEIFKAEPFTYKFATPLLQNEKSWYSKEFIKLYEGYFAHASKILEKQLAAKLCDAFNKVEKDIKTKIAKTKPADPQEIVKKQHQFTSEWAKRQFDDFANNQIPKLGDDAWERARKLVQKKAKNAVFDEKKRKVGKVVLGVTSTVALAAVGIAVGAATLGTGAPAYIAFGVTALLTLIGTVISAAKAVKDALASYNKHLGKAAAEIKAMNNLAIKLEGLTKQRSQPGVKDKLSVIFKASRIQSKTMRKEFAAAEKHLVALEASQEKLDKKVDDFEKKANDFRSKVEKARKEGALDPKTEKVLKQLEKKEDQLVDNGEKMNDKVQRTVVAFTNTREEARQAEIRLEEIFKGKKDDGASAASAKAMNYASQAMKLGDESFSYVSAFLTFSVNLMSLFNKVAGMIKL